MNDNLIIKIKDTTKGRPTIIILGYSYYHKKDNVDSVRYVCHQKTGVKECFASVTIGKDGNPEVLKLNGLKMKSNISKQQQLIESHNIEVKHDLLDDIDLDVVDTVNRYACVSFNHLIIFNLKLNIYLFLE